MIRHRALRTLLLAGPAATALVGTALADPPAEPFALVPTDAPGLSTGYLQPEGTNEARIGTRQPTETQAGTGTQVYDGALSFRGYWPFQIGVAASVFDDPFNQPFAGEAGNFTLGSIGIGGKLSLRETARSALALEAGVAYLKYGFDGAGEKEDLFGATLSLPATYRLTDRVFLTGELGYTVLPDDAQNRPAPGSRGIAAIGIGLQPTDRLFLYGTAKALFRDDDTGPEAGEDTILTLGARAALTPQLAGTLFVTTGYADTPVLDDLAFLPDPGAPVFGAALTYVPSGKRFNIPRYRQGVPAVDRTFVTGDGITLMGPQTIGSNDLRVALSAGTSGNTRLDAALSPDPDFQLELVVETYALEGTEGFRSEAAEDTRYAIGARYQALSEAEGDPLSLGGRLQLGRDVEEPTVGVLYGELSAAKDLGPRANLRINPRYAASGVADIGGLGIGIDYDLSERFQTFGEYTAVTDGRDGIWAAGLRRTFPEALSAIDIYATNAAGRSGIGSMLDADPQLGLTFTWQTPFRAF